MSYTKNDDGEITPLKNHKYLQVANKKGEDVMFYNDWELKAYYEAKKAEFERIARTEKLAQKSQKTKLFAFWKKEKKQIKPCCT